MSIGDSLREDDQVENAKRLLETGKILLPEDVVGLGPDEDTRMIAQSKNAVGSSTAYLIYFPGLALFLTILAVNFLGDGLRDALDPQSGR